MSEQRHLRISYSSRSLLSCGAKFNFAKLHNQPRSGRSVYMDMGTALHRGFQKYLITKDQDQAIFEYMTNHPVDLVSNPMDNYSVESGLSTLFAMMEQETFQRCEIAKIMTKDGIIRPAIEVPFEIFITDFSLSDQYKYTVSYVGFIDAIMWDPVDECFRVLEIKTTGAKNIDDYTAKYHFDEQTIPYGLVLQYMEGKPIHNFLSTYLIAQVHALDATAQIYEYSKNAEAVSYWYQGLLLDLHQLKTMIQMNWFPRSGGSKGICMAYNKPCWYYEACKLDHDVLHKNILLELANEEEVEKDRDVMSKTQHVLEPWVEFHFSAKGE